jgi:hypothetical protein
MPRTLNQIREDGLQALREKLGRAGMVRFLQQFELGSGDYTRSRRDWVETVSIGDIRREARKRRQARAKKDKVASDGRANQATKSRR